MKLWNKNAPPKFRTVNIREFERFDNLLAVIAVLHAALVVVLCAGFASLIWFLMGVPK